MIILSAEAKRKMTLRWLVEVANSTDGYEMLMAAIMASEERDRYDYENSDCSDISVEDIECYINSARPEGGDYAVFKRPNIKHRWFGNDT